MITPHKLSPERLGEIDKDIQDANLHMFDGARSTLLELRSHIAALEEERVQPLTEGEWTGGLKSETRSYIACELDHDLREGRIERIRWNNRAMALAICSITKLEKENASLKQQFEEANNKNVRLMKQRDPIKREVEAELSNDLKKLNIDAL